MSDHTTIPMPSACLEYVLDATHFAGKLAEQIADTLERASADSGVGWTHVVGKKRAARLAFGRKVVASALRDLVVGDDGRLSLEEIGLIMGGRDHTTIMYYLGSIKRQEVHPL